MSNLIEIKLVYLFVSLRRRNDCLGHGVKRPHMGTLILWLSLEVRLLHSHYTDIIHCHQSLPCHFKVALITPNSLLITKHTRNHFTIHFYALKNYAHCRLTAFPPNITIPQKNKFRGEQSQEKAIGRKEEE